MSSVGRPPALPPRQLAIAIGYMLIMGTIWGLQISLAKLGALHQIPPVAWTLFVNGLAINDKGSDGYTGSLTGNSAELPEPTALALVAPALAALSSAIQGRAAAGTSPRKNRF